MQRAYEAITGLPSTRAGGLLDADHYHVRIVLQEDEQYYSLIADQSVDFYPYPLDADVPEGAICYLDDLQAEDAPPVLYACVPVEYVFPAGVSYDIIEELILAGIDESEEEDGGEPLDGSVTLGMVTLMSGSIKDPSVPIDPVDPFDPCWPVIPPSGRFRCEVAELYNTETWKPLGNPDDSGNGGGGNSGGSGNGGGTGGGGNTGGSGSNGSGTGGITFSPNKPHGRITVWDDLMQTHIPLEGVKVTVRKNMFKSYTVTTNSAGCFQINEVISSGNKKTYKITWETGRYDIRDNGQAFYHGPKIKSNTWNLSIGSSGDGNRSMRYATIHRAAHRYFYGNIDGLIRPDFFRKTKIRYFHYDGRSVTVGFFRMLGIFPDLKIYGRFDDRTNWKNTQTLFYTVCHELGHFQHWHSVGRTVFNRTMDSIVESWACAVGWHLANVEYSDRRLPLDDLMEYINSTYISRMNWPYNYDVYGNVLDSGEEINYSPLFIDLIDDHNQGRRNWDGDYDSRYPDDNVTGYNISLFNSNLSSLLGLLCVMELVKKQNNIPDGITEEMIDTLFSKYEEIW